MTRFKVSFEPEALEDLDQIQLWIAEHGSVAIAEGFAERLVGFCQALERFPLRGTDRSDIRAGLRIMTFERSVSVAFRVEGQRVAILRMTYRGRDLEAFLAAR